MAFSWAISPHVLSTVDHWCCWALGPWWTTEVWDLIHGGPRKKRAYLLAVRASLSKFEFTQVEQIGREHNSHADVLAKLATVMETNLQRTVTIEVLDLPSSRTGGPDMVCMMSPATSWMDPLVAYMQDDQLPEDQKAASIIKRKAPGYWLSKDGSLYKRSF
jgi:hypothetical protein